MNRYQCHHQYIDHHSGRVWIGTSLCLWVQQIQEIQLHYIVYAYQHYSFATKDQEQYSD